MPSEIDPAAPAPAPAVGASSLGSAPAAPAPAVAPADTPPAVPAAPAVPEKYEFKLPEGFYDPSVIERVGGMAKEYKLQPEAAQALLDKTISEVKQFEASIGDGMARVKEQWKATLAADVEIGGSSLVKSQELAKGVLTKFASEGLITDLEKTGFADHPEMLRFLSRIGRSMREDDFITPGSQSGSPVDKDPAASLYDHPTSKSA